MVLKILVFLIMVCLSVPWHSVSATEYIQVSGLLDLRTTYSDGEMDLDALIALARERGFEAVFINDHDRLAVEYGLFPLRHVLKKRKELNSINKGGAECYLLGIQKARTRYPDMIIVPGSESAPFYYWTGSYFDKNLTAHNHEKRILTVGLDRPDDYENLPVLHNGCSVQFVTAYLPEMMLFLVPLVLGLWLLKWKGMPRKSGLIISGLSILFMANANPFSSSPFDQYHGDQGIAPYQLLIDYVDSRGGLTFWNYPETKSGVRKLGSIFVSTPPYPEVLEQSKGYTGFAALYGDHITVTEPGHAWDRALLAYCKGERERPVWGISTADFHKDGGAGEILGNYPTVFFLREKTMEEILFAMKAGRMYACRSQYPQQIILNEFSVCSRECVNKAISGEEIVLKEDPWVHISLSLKKPQQNKVQIRLIRSGRLIKTMNGSLPIEIDYEDTDLLPHGKIYYRIDVRGRGCGKLVSNPIFVTFE